MKLFKLLVLGVVSLSIFAGCGKVAVETEDSKADFVAIKAYALDNAEKVSVSAAKLEESALAYYQAVDNKSPEALKALEDAKTHWLNASTYYELDEGIVAGVPELSDFDVWLDAGPSKEEDPVEARDWTLELKDGRKLESPGNLFHSVLEPAIWSAEVDAELLLAGAESLNDASEEMIAAINAWEVNLSDVFTALVTMVPTMNEYFDQWKNSYYITGEASEGEAFVAVSRLVDIQGILTGLSFTYNNVEMLVEEENVELNGQIKADFERLMEFVGGVYEQEQAGKRFTAEEADLLGAKAQAMATNLAGLVAQAASLLKVELQ